MTVATPNEDSDYVVVGVVDSPSVCLDHLSPFSQGRRTHPRVFLELELVTRRCRISAVARRRIPSQERTTFWTDDRCRSRTGWSGALAYDTQGSVMSAVAP